MIRSNFTRCCGMPEFPEPPLSALLRIDRICGDFEASWFMSPRPEPLDFLGTLEDEPWREELICRLFAIHAENALRYGRSDNQGSLAVIFGDRLGHVVSLAMLFRLACLEFEARQRWSQPPTVSEFAASLPDSLRSPSLRTALRDVLHTSAPISLAISASGALCLRTPLDTTLILGRQSRGEPSPIVRFDLPPQDDIASEPLAKVALAPISDRFLSRRQLKLERVTQHATRITNVGSKLTLCLEGDAAIPPHESFLVEGNFVIDFLEYQVRSEPDGPW